MNSVYEMLLEGLQPIFANCPEWVAELIIPSFICYLIFGCLFGVIDLIKKLLGGLLL